VGSSTLSVLARDGGRVQMVTHVFVLVLMIGGKEISRDMHFYSIVRCNYFAGQVSKRYGHPRVGLPPEQSVLAYCKPKLVDTSRVQVYE
jgi:hypothetical protein